MYYSAPRFRATARGCGPRVTGASVVDAPLEALLGAASGPVNWRNSSRTTGPGLLHASAPSTPHSSWRTARLNDGGRRDRAGVLDSRPQVRRSAGITVERVLI